MSAQNDSLGEPPSMVATVREVVGIVAALALLVCSVRLYLRKFVTHAFGLDDILVIPALLLVLGFAALSITLTFYGIGYHQYTVPLKILADMQYYIYILFCLYLWVALAVKISLTVFIMRLFPTPTINRIGIGVIVFLVLVTISGELPLIFQCKPVRAAYDKSLEDFTCMSDKTLQNIQLYQAVLMFVIDVVIIVLPMPTIWKLQMPLQRRLSIIALFALGFVACAAGLARIPLLGFQDASDYSYAGAVPLILMNTEFGLGLVTGSLPSLRILLRFSPGMKSTQKSSTHRTNERATNGSSGPGPAYQLSSRSQVPWSQKMHGWGRKGGDAGSIGSGTGSQERIVPRPPEPHIRQP